LEQSSSRNYARQARTSADQPANTRKKTANLSSIALVDTIPFLSINPSFDARRLPTRSADHNLKQNQPMNQYVHQPKTPTRPKNPLKLRSLLLLTSLAIATAGLVACRPFQSQDAKLSGAWRYEAPIEQERVFGNTVVTERIDLTLLRDGNVDLNWTRGAEQFDNLVGAWKQQGDLLIMTRPNHTFGVFRILGVEEAELRILTRAGRIYRLTRLPT
jgi:hypothetical protein